MTVGPSGSGSNIPPRLVVLAGRKGKPSLLPFMCVLLVVLTLGLIGLLLLNTAVNKGAFELRKRQQEQTKLTQQEQLYQQELSKLSEPGALATKAAELGMVPAGNPAFLDPVAGGMLGTPAPPTPVPTPSAAPTTVATTAPATTPITLPASGGTPAQPPNPAGAPPAALPTTPAQAATAPKPTSTTAPMPTPTPTATPTAGAERR